MTPIKLIKALRKTDGYIKYIFIEGSCYQFYIFLKAFFSDAKPYINSKKDHVVSKINGKLYDINGIVEPENYKLLTKADLKKVKKWSFRKNNILKITECPACGEPICV